MCGINVCFGEENINRMNTILGHRGIRSTYKHLDNDLFLGHVRLPIQGVHPLHDHPEEFMNFIGAFVGEIFNYKEINPDAKSDLPVLLQQFVMNGPDSFDQFDGFWSAIIYSKNLKKLFIVTDYLAKKPLYIRHEPFGISSEVKALASLEKNTFDELYFSSVAKWGYCTEERTPFNEIKKIPAGSFITVDSNGKIYSKRTDNPLKPKRTDINKALRTAVKNRMVSDIPISILMSGGLDSTMIYYYMREFTDNIDIFHIENEEAEYLNCIPFRSGDKIHSISIEHSTYHLNDILVMNDGPVDLGSMIPQFLLARKIWEQEFNVCLSGDGADELFGGYSRINIYDSQYSDIFHELIYYHLPKLDKMMMSFTVELRNPFLARPVIEGALALPYYLRKNKPHLKDIAHKLGVPEKIINRKKKALRYKQEDNQRYSFIERYQNIMREHGIV